jgi:hypothetical protein
MAFTSTDLQALDLAIASGEQRVTFGDPPRTVEYRTVTDLLAARNFIAKSIAADATSGTTRTAPRYQVASFND